MQTNHIEEITFVMCECCYQFIVEEMPQGHKDIFYCSECAEVLP